MPSSGIIDLSLGIIFVFGATAALSSVITELISRLLGLRGAYLMLGLRELLDGNDAIINLGEAESDFSKLTTLMNNAPAPPAPGGPAPAAVKVPEQEEPTSATSALLGSPILGSQGVTGQLTSRPLTMSKNNRSSLPKSTGKGTWSLRRSLPSYIPARSFAEALIDLLVPDTAGQTTMDTIQHYIGQLPDSLGTLKTSLQTLATNAGGDINRFRTSVENWYDDHMDRVSGWYKRHVAVITLAVGAVLVLLLNINTITIGRVLYGDSVIRSAVSTVAAKDAPPCQPGQGEQSCLADLQAQLAAAAQGGLPIGWGTVPACAAANAHCNWLEQRGLISPNGGSAWQLILALIGFLITIVALTPGAQFWFGLLAKLGSLRACGPPPPAAAR